MSLLTICLCSRSSHLLWNFSYWFYQKPKFNTSRAKSNLANLAHVIICCRVGWCKMVSISGLVTGASHQTNALKWLVSCHKQSYPHFFRWWSQALLDLQKKLYPNPKRFIILCLCHIYYCPTIPSKSCVQT